MRSWNRRVEALARLHENVTIVRGWKQLVDESPKFTYLMDVDAVHPNRRGRRALAGVMADAAHTACQ